MHLLNFYNGASWIWDDMNNNKDASRDDRGFIRDYYTYFKDNVDLSVSYPGGFVKRNDMVSYINGVDLTPDPKNAEWTDFELVQSFAVTKQKVTQDQLKYWLNKQNKYSTSNYMKAAYGTFLTALLVIGCHDSIAEKIAANFEVNWNRHKYTLVMNGITQQQTYIHTADASMGMNIISSKNDNNSIKAFRFACSSILSPIEDKILKSESFQVNSVLLGTGQQLLKGTVINIEDKGNNTIVHTYNDNNTKITIDSDKYLVKENIGQYKGSTSTKTAYCYYDRQTKRATDLGDRIINNNCGWLGTLGGLATTIGSTIGYMTIKGTIPPGKEKYVLGIILGFAGILMEGKDAGIFDGELDTNKAAKFLVGVALSVVPLYGTGGGTVGELVISYVGKDGIKREVTHVPGNFEGYVITTMKVRPGDAFKGGNILEPIYVVSAQYIKYGASEAVLKTAIGKTPQEAIRELIKSNSIQEGSNIIIDTYKADNDKYDSQKYKNIQEYLK
jgi:co-chaperonin GroES (HSP10)